MRLSKWYSFVRSNAKKISASDSEIMNYSKEQSRITGEDHVVVCPETRQIVVFRKGERVV